MIDVNKVKFPLRLFSPAEDYKWSVSIQTPRELQLLLDVAARNDIPYRLNEKDGKFFLGHGPNWKAPDPTAPVKIAPPASASFAGLDGKGYVKVGLIPQHYPDSCGQTSVAMAINTIMGYTGSKMWDDNTVHNKYGYDLERALDTETGLNWSSPDFTPNSWDLIEHNLDCGYPVLFAANGPLFSKSGHGHVLLIYQLKGTGPNGQVFFADPNKGVVTERTRKECEDAPPHPQGKWLMLVKTKIGK